MKPTNSPEPQDAIATEKLAGIVFISLPLNLQEKFGELELDPDRLLPVETGNTDEKWNIAELSWEMIISGMLKILAWKPEHEDADYYRRFIRKVKPELQRELTDAGIVKARNHEYDLAEEIFRALVGLEPANGRYLLNLALLYEERAGVYRNLENVAQQEIFEQKAFAWYRNTLSLDEVPAETYLYAGYFYLRNNNFAQATDALEMYVKTGDDDEQKAKAQKLLDEIAERDLEDTQFKEAYDFIRMEREEEGIERISEFLAKHPKVWNAWFILGWANRRLGHWDAGRDAFLKAVEHGGGTADTLNELAICQMELAEYQSSRLTLEKALRLEPDNVKIMSNLGILCLKQDQKEEAAAFFRTVLEFEPEDRIAQEYLAHLDAE